jgi:glycosyltransferase involved in cell wall biosynthesis
MNIVVCWAGMQGYVAACLKALHRLNAVRLFVIHLDFEDVPAQEDLLQEIPNKQFIASHSNTEISGLVAKCKPDAVFLSGWFYPRYRQLIHCQDLRETKFILGMDTPWIGSWQQQLNRLRLRNFIRRMDIALVASVQSREFAQRIGVNPTKIVTGLYGFDFSAFREIGVRHLDVAPDWPRTFLFAGRYVPEKGIGVLMEAYRRYRRQVGDPWPLVCCGSGPENARLLGQEGVRDLGYQLPSKLPALFAQHGVFVMPSLVEPWGVAIAEAAATGLPLICSDACGAARDVLREYYNGLTVRSGDPAALTAAMVWMHDNYQRLRTLGPRGRSLAQAHSAEIWAERLQACVARTRDITKEN